MPLHLRLRRDRSDDDNAMTSLRREEHKEWAPPPLDHFDTLQTRHKHPIPENLDHIIDTIANMELRERLTPLMGGGASERCSGCRLPWDKGKRRRLVEACGHSRCAICAARTATCPQCAPRTRAQLRTRSRPPQLSSTESGSEEESPLRSRLGVLLGARRRSRATRRSRVAAPPRPTHASLLSLVSLDVSPVSTLTGSSEAEGAAGGADVCRGRVTDSLPSISPSPAGSFCSHLSRSLTASQDEIEKCTGIPYKYRKYNQKTSRSSNEFYHQSIDILDDIGVGGQLPLKPLYFEVATSSREPFVGRTRLLVKMEEWLSRKECGMPASAVVTGVAGSGKTALVLQLVERSCFGRGLHAASADTAKSDTDALLDGIAARVVGYHFCQADNAPTCQRGELVHSLAAQLCQAPRLSAYRRLLASSPALLAELTPRACAADPAGALRRGVMRPLAELHAAGALPPDPGLLLVDALCEADYHRPEAGDSLGDFLLRVAADCLPPCLRLLATRRRPPMISSCDDSPQPLHLPLDDGDRDVLEYVSLRMDSADALRANVKSPTGKCDGFAHYVSTLARGSFLFAKLILDLCESGLIVLKAANYKVIPVNLAQIFTLQFNIRFPTAQSFEKIGHILSVCLASLYPLTDDEIYATVNSLLVDQFLPVEEFQRRMSTLGGFVARRSDGTNVFFHPAFREWLVRRDAGDADKFLCDLRAGHAALAFRLSRSYAPLDAERTSELAHHALKAHPFKEANGGAAGRDLLAAWIADASSGTTNALVEARNAYSPNARVSRLLLLGGAFADALVDGERAPLACVWAARGETAAVLALLDAHASVDAADASGRTPLALAAAAGHEEVARALIAAGADPSAADDAGCTPLAFAARAGHRHLLSLLLSADGDSPAALSALVAAAEAGHRDIVSILVEAVDAQVDSACPLSGQTALTAACGSATAIGRGAAEAIEALLCGGARVDAADARDWRPLACASARGALELCRLLLSAGANPRGSPDDARSPLSAAAADGHLAVLQLLLHHGADPQERDGSGRGALWWACFNGHADVASALLAAGAPAEPPLAPAACRPLLACRAPAAAELLLARGADPERVDFDGTRLIDKHVADGNLPMICLFLKKGVKLGPNTWSMAQGKPHIIGMLVNKLLDDGNALYRRGELEAASHRYGYAIRHLPVQRSQKSGQTHRHLVHLEANLLLNMARCKRKLDEPAEALELAAAGAALRPLCWEGWYGVARAARAAGAAARASAAARRALALLSPRAPPHFAAALRSLVDDGSPSFYAPYATDAPDVPDAL